MPLTADSLRVPHGFFTRQGGLSAGPYTSLNCSLSGGDDRDIVLQNRARAASAIGARAEHLVGLMQVHGAEVVEVTTAWSPGQGPRADAMVTARPGIALGVITADCAPILLADTSAGVVGAAHAGWRGAVAGVIEATVCAMTGLGATAATIAAAIGPCIGQASYEVGADLRDAVLTRDPAYERFFLPGRQPMRWQFDLSGYCAARLATVGVRSVAAMGFDTAADEERFFSYRRQTLAGGGPTGHQISIIALDPR
ncbi:MAG TPA: peptidoglycan editing factor PgeF [Acetobacteraceae bacterium]|nr:peptidoglycan editing factor PgeF [Acetobacteraceae bacterium]